MAGKPVEGRKKIPRRGNETHKRAYFSEKSLGQMIAVANRAYTKVISCGSQNVQRKSIFLLKREREFIAMRLILTYVTVPFFNPYNLFSHFLFLFSLFLYSSWSSPPPPPKPLCNWGFGWYIKITFLPSFASQIPKVARKKGGGELVRVPKNETTVVNFAPQYDRIRC